MNDARKDINKSVKTLISFISENTKLNVVQYCRSSKVDVNDGDLRKISAVIENAIEQAFTNGYNSVQKVLDKHSI